MKHSEKVTQMNKEQLLELITRLIAEVGNLRAENTSLKDEVGNLRAENAHLKAEIEQFRLFSILHG
jgi:regulator of replication initiation timing